MAKALLPLVLTAALFLSCGGQSAFFRRTDRATIARVDGFDDELARIAENARATLDVFFRHLNMPAAGEGNFFVKYAFRVEGEADGVVAEHVWIGGIVFRNGRYYGVVSSAPVYLTRIRRGSRVNFHAGAITDWMFTRDGKIVGGHSIRRLLERIPEGERTVGQRETLQMFE